MSRRISDFRFPIGDWGRGGLLLLLVTGYWSLITSAKADTHYVSPSGSNTAPFTTWATAATNIHAAVDAASAGDEVVVTNGNYYLTNELRVVQWMTLRSVNGYRVTKLLGDFSYTRCVYMDDPNAVVEGFTIQGGHATDPYSMGSVSGGGVYLNQGLLARCAIVGNTAETTASAMSGYVSGGGVYAGPDGVIRSCLIKDNSAIVNLMGMPGMPYGGTAVGGGVWGGILENCTVVGNRSAFYCSGPSCGAIVTVEGSGVYNCSLENTIVWGNLYVPDCGSIVSASYSCAPTPMTGVGNSTNAPVFTAIDDDHLRSSSPCFGSGVNQPWMGSGRDLDGLPRVLGGQVDRGCFEQAREVSLFAPAISQPLPVLPGQTNTFWTSNRVLAISGTKASGCWVVVQSPAGGFLTNGIEQKPASNTWAYSAALGWGATIETIRVVFGCAITADLTCVSASTTVLRVRNAGFGVPGAWFIGTPGTVGFGATNCVLNGTNTINTIGNLSLSNAVNGATSSCPAAEPPASWAAPALDLVLGTNILWAKGSNMLGDVAFASKTVVRGGLGTPVMTLTSTPVFVDFGQTSFALGGSNNLHVAGLMILSNAATGETVLFPSPIAEPYRWTTAPIPLVPGSNVLTVVGTNLLGTAVSASVAITRAGAGDPTLDITSPSRAYTFGITNVTVSGSNNPHIVGTMWLTNISARAGVAFSARAFRPYTWTSPSFPLVTGVNEVIVYGTNVLGALQSDTLFLTRTTGTVHYVRQSGATPAVPYDTWETAATSIDIALSESGAGETILVGTGTYSALYLYKDVHVRSLAGPRTTGLTGGGYSTPATVSSSNAVLEGFTISGAYLWGMSGGGVSMSAGTVRNCVIVSNTVSAYTIDYVMFIAAYGGGVYMSGGRLENCLVRANSSYSMYGGPPGNSGGGGVYCVGGVIANCTVVGNSAGGDGGGIYRGAGSVVNSIAVSNTDGGGSQPDDIAYPSTNVFYSCSPAAPSGQGNVNFDPSFVGNGYFRLSRSSGCIDRGLNQAWMTNAVELDYKPRLLNGTVDMGAYESPYLVTLTATLEGAYEPSLLSMRTNLHAAIPLTAPYQAAPVFVTSIPSNAVDWILVTFHPSPASAPIMLQAAFLAADGGVLRADGTLV